MTQPTVFEAVNSIMKICNIPANIAYKPQKTEDNQVVIINAWKMSAPLKNFEMHLIQTFCVLSSSHPPPPQEAETM